MLLDVDGSFGEGPKTQLRAVREMSRDQPKWWRLYLALQPTLRGAESIPAGEAFTAANGSTRWNYNTAHQWKMDMDRNLQRGVAGSATSVGVANAPRLYQYDGSRLLPRPARPAGTVWNQFGLREGENLSNALRRRRQARTAQQNNGCGAVH
jgi:hypothetical protein